MNEIFQTGMKAIAYYLSLPFLYLISILPFSVLYFLSDVLYLIIYIIIGYRKNVVRQNLKNSFPEKTEKEILEIEKKFFSHLCDLIVEVIKFFTISKTELVQRCVLDKKTIALFEDLKREKKQTVIVTSHCGNWEWCGSAFQLQTGYPVTIAYRPLTNEFFDGFFYKMRGRFGNKLVSVNDVLRYMIGSKEIVQGTAFISDQTPPGRYDFWTKFMNQNTPVYTGAEKIARKFNFPVAFFHIHKIRRGYYEMSGEIISENPSSSSDGEITSMHTKLLEQDIRENPEFWLWSHKRWKHAINDI